MSMGAQDGANMCELVGSCMIDRFIIHKVQQKEISALS